MKRVRVEPVPRKQEAESAPVEAAGDQHLVEELDAILDEIDAVLEENAEKFVRNYVQKGGE